jgi:hypothetical protein
MSAGWVAASVRARAMGHRRAGFATARIMATSATYGEAVDSLSHSPYADHVHPGDDLASASHGVAAALLWNIRVLAGWLPPTGADMLRALAAWFEIANIEHHLRALSGQPAPAPFHLGALATAWPRLAVTGSAEQLAAELAGSGWGRPSGPTPYDIALSLRLSWARRVVARVPVARPWTVAAVGLLLARERFSRAASLPAATVGAAGRVVGAAAAGATNLVELRDRLPRDGQWVLDGITDAGDLWRAEARWWQRLRTDSARLVAGAGFGPDPVVGAAGLLAADAHLVVGALALAGRGPGSAEVFDELA